MPRTVDIVGKRFGRLVVLALASRDRWKGRSATFVCQCDCGQITITVGSDLKRRAVSRVQSCGCAHREWSAARLRGQTLSMTHGCAVVSRRSKEYRAWGAMKDRCRPEHAQHRDYYDRGITVCSEWARSFVAFLSHVGMAPGSEYSIDRIDNDKGYEPGNVRWATPAEQARNRRTATQGNQRSALQGERQP